MKKNHRKILKLLKVYLRKNPDQRFGQALFNLGVNEFQKSNDPKKINTTLRDIYNDNDNDIINRIERKIKWFGLQERVAEKISRIDNLKGTTVNERLVRCGLMDLFEKYEKTDKEFAMYILKSIRVDEESIEKILN